MLSCNIEQECLPRCKNISPDIVYFGWFDYIITWAGVTVSVKMLVCWIMNVLSEKDFFPTPQLSNSESYMCCYCLFFYTSSALFSYGRRLVSASILSSKHKINLHSESASLYEYSGFALAEL